MSLICLFRSFFAKYICMQINVLYKLLLVTHKAFDTFILINRVKVIQILKDREAGQNIYQFI